MSGLCDGMLKLSEIANIQVESFLSDFEGNSYYRVERPEELFYMYKQIKDGIDNTSISYNMMHNLSVENPIIFCRLIDYKGGKDEWITLFPNAIRSIKELARYISIPREEFYK